MPEENSLAPPSNKKCEKCMSHVITNVILKRNVGNTSQGKYIFSYKSTIFALFLKLIWIRESDSTPLLLSFAARTLQRVTIKEY